ncbi:MAG: hypothetical protein RLY31_2733 [Bacteroidota bacterium]
MTFNFRICKNDTTSALREMFGATPVRVPESSIQPMLVIAERHGKTDRRGELHHLLSQPSALRVDIHEDTVADVNLQRTRSMDWRVGLKLLDGFFQGLRLPSAALGARMNNGKEMSLSFRHVRRRWIDKNELGTALRDRKLDLSHPAARIFSGENAHRLLLVTDVILSNGFSIDLSGSGSGERSISLPEIQQIVTDANSAVSVSGNSNNSIAFEGPEFLTFAFSCVLLQVDPDSGLLTVGTAVSVDTKPIGTTPGYESAAVPPEPVDLDDDLFEPGLLDWDD